MTLRILVTGSRSWIDCDAIRQALVTAGRQADVHPDPRIELVIHARDELVIPTRRRKAAS